MRRLAVRRPFRFAHAEERLAALRAANCARAEIPCRAMRARRPRSASRSAGSRNSALVARRGSRDRRKTAPARPCRGRCGATAPGRGLPKALRPAARAASRARSAPAGTTGRKCGLSATTRCASTCTSSTSPNESAARPATSRKYWTSSPTRYAVVTSSGRPSPSSTRPRAKRSSQRRAIDRGKARAQRVEHGRPRTWWQLQAAGWRWVGFVHWATWVEPRERSNRFPAEPRRKAGANAIRAGLRRRPREHRPRQTFVPVA